MNFKTFLAMLARDAHVARRNAVTLAFQTLLQPMLFVFVFGRVMTTSGLMTAQYKALLLPGVIALAMIMSGTWAVTMPLISEFQFTKEIEDRLLAPMDIEWLAVEKVVAGMVQAIVAGLVVIPTGWLVMGGVSFDGVSILRFAAVALLVAALSATLGLVLGCSIGQQHVGLMFSMVMAPMIFFGCTYYPLGRAGEVPDPAARRADQPAGLRERGLPRRPGPSLPASGVLRGPRRAARLRCRVPAVRPAAVPAESDQLNAASSRSRTTRRRSENHSRHTAARSDHRWILQ